MFSIAIKYVTGNTIWKLSHDPINCPAFHTARIKRNSGRFRQRHRASRKKFLLDPCRQLMVLRDTYLSSDSSKPFAQVCKNSNPLRDTSTCCCYKLFPRGSLYKGCSNEQLDPLKKCPRSPFKHHKRQFFVILALPPIKPNVSFRIETLNHSTVRRNCSSHIQHATNCSNNQRCTRGIENGCLWYAEHTESAFKDMCFHGAQFEMELIAVNAYQNETVSSNGMRENGGQEYHLR